MRCPVCGKEIHPETIEEINGYTYHKSSPNKWHRITINVKSVDAESLYEFMKRHTFELLPQKKNKPNWGRTITHYDR